MSSNGDRPQLPPGMDTGTIRAIISEFTDNANHLAESRDELLPAHEDEWVASYGGEFAFGTTLDEAVAAARDRAWPMGVVAIEHLTRERAPILL